MTRWFLTAVMMLSATYAAGAEIRLRESVAIDTAIVRLGDVADVTEPIPSDAAALAAIELFPAPAEGEWRWVRSRELIDLLVRRGVDFSVHRIGGANTVKLARVKPQLATQTSKPLRSTQKQAAKEKVAAAMTSYVLAQFGPDVPPQQREQLQVTCDLSDEQMRALLQADVVQVLGGQYPWIGKQQLEILAGQMRFVVTAEIELPAATVVAARPLTRGQVIRAIDVRVDFDRPQRIAQTSFQSPADLIGKQTTTAIGEGRPLARSQVREPIVLRRGEVVAVSVRNAGIRIRTEGKARADAAQGEVIEVESRDDRKRTFHARATGEVDRHTGFPIVEVFGRAPSVTSNDTILR